MNDKQKLIGLENRLKDMYSELELMDKDIDVRILKRNQLFNEIETGVALLLTLK